MSAAQRQVAPVSGHTLTVDWARCTGQGVCAAALGERIALDRWGFPTGVTTGGVDVPVGLVEAARLAVVSCPAAALSMRPTARA